MILKSIHYLTLLMLIGMGILFYTKMSPIFLNKPNEKHLKFNEVLGAVAFRKGIPYTLNFDQQNFLLHYLNDLQPTEIQLTDKPNKNLDFEKIILYRFDKSDLVFNLIEIDHQNNLYFDIPEWNPAGLMKDKSLGKMRLCLNNF